MIRLAKSLPKPIYKPKPKIEPVEEVKIDPPSTALNQEKEIELLTSIHETLNKPEEKEVEEVESVNVENFPEIQKVRVLNFPAFPEQKECEHEMPEFPSEIRVSNLDEIKVLPGGLAKESRQVTANDLLKEVRDLLDKLKFTRDGELKTTGSGTAQNGTALLGGRGVMPVGASTSANQDLEIAALQDILTELSGVLAVRVSNISAEPTESSVGDSITSVTLLAANTSRSEVYILNDSTATLRISLSGTATSSSPYILRPGEGLAIRSNADGKVYMGIVSGIWDSAPGGYARVVEFI